MTIIDTALVATAVLFMSGLWILPLLGFEKFAAYAFFLGCSIALYFALVRTKKETCEAVQPTVVSTSKEIVQPPQPARSDNAMGGFVAIVSALVNLATAVFVQMIYRFGIFEYSFAGISLSLMSNAFIGLALYIWMNAYSGRVRPPGLFFKYIVDFLPSLIAALSIWSIMFSEILAIGSVADVSTIPGAAQLLLVLSAAAFMDLVFNQRANAKEALARFRGESFTETISAHGAPVVTRRMGDLPMFGNATIHQLNQIDCRGKDVVVHPPVGNQPGKIEILDPPGTTAAA